MDLNNADFPLELDIGNIPELDIGEIRELGLWEMPE